MGIVACATIAQPLDGRQIAFEAGSQTSLSAPVSVKYDGAVPEKGVEVVDVKSKKRYPATVRDGELVFVVDKAKPGSKAACVVEARKGDGPPEVAITKTDGDVLNVTIGGELFTAYHFSNENRKPFLWPVNGEGGVTVTRNWPMGDVEGSEDHHHHKSLWTSYGDLNGIDCWGEGDSAGNQVSGDVAFGSGDAYGWITAKNSWQSKEGQEVLKEEREYRFYTCPADQRMLDVKVTFTATDGDVLWKDTKEGGIVAVRVRDEIRVKNGGTITNALGGHGEPECWGKPSPWCDYAGPFADGKVRGIAVLDHPTNLRHPSRWHVRDYGLMGANCFGLSYFTKNEDKQLNGDYTLKDGESVTFNYRVLVHSGTAEKANIADRYADYSTPPKAAWTSGG
jgi:Family of unknown function (DUF6807)